MAAGKKTGGRTKGVLNKRTEARATVIAVKAKAGITPLEYMLAVLNDETADPRERSWAAGAAAPFCHPKLANVELGNLKGEVFRVGLLADDSGIL